MPDSELSAARLQLPEVLARVAAHATFEIGSSYVRALMPATDPVEVKARLTATTQARWLLAENPGISIGGARDVRATARAAARGSQLTPGDLQAIATQLQAVRLTRRALEVQHELIPALWSVVQPLNARPAMEAKIQNTLDEQGRIFDSASPELQSVREQLRQAVTSVHAIMQQQLQLPGIRGLLQDDLITERAGRQVVPVKRERQSSLPGVVHDASASGATVYIEPLAAVSANNHVRTLEAAERHEIDRILRALSMEVGTVHDDIMASVEGLGLLDEVLARARYADHQEAVEPIVAPDVGVKFKNARHPLLDGNAVPIDVDISPGASRAIVITGPNTGGKTVALKTIGLLHLMVACGLHVPATYARLSVYDRVMADIGDEQSIEKGLSTFASHMENLVDMVQTADPGSLVLVDELGSGTDPAEGAALGQAILERLLEAKSTIVVTTHHPELKVFAHHHPRVRNASVEFDTATLQPTYRLVMDLPGRSNAFDIAVSLGLDASVVASARAKVDAQLRNVEELIEALQRDRENLAKSQRSVNDQARCIADTEQTLSERLFGLDDEYERVISDARREARALLRAARKAMRQASEARTTDSREVATREARRVEELLDATGQEQIVASTTPILAIQEGDRVRVDGFSRDGVVTLVGEQEAEIALGSVRSRVLRAHVREVLKPDLRPHSRRPVEHGTNTTVHQVSIRGKRAADALETLDHALDRAILEGSLALRVIHGKGTGALRQAVREHARGHPGVEGMSDAEPEAGGTGVTVLSLA